MATQPKSAISCRMKQLERATRAALPRKTFTVIRVDGRAFHTYTRGLDRPYDLNFMRDMDQVACALLADASGAVLGYVQSDEISILLTDTIKEETQPWFGGVVSKLTSITAATATAALMERRPGKRAIFDSRAFTVPAEEVTDYFMWRQRDAIRNSIQMTAQEQFSHKRLQGLRTGELQELLQSDASIDWEHDMPAGFKRGRVIERQFKDERVQYVDKRSGEKCTTVATRKRWVARPAGDMRDEVSRALRT